MTGWIHGDSKKHKYQEIDMARLQTCREGKQVAEKVTKQGN